MSKWIKVNLPWNKFIYNDSNGDSFPDLSERMIKVFGKTKKQHYEEISMEDGFTVDDLISDKSKKEISLLFKSNPLVVKVLEHRKISKKINDWIKNQPEVLEWCKRADKRDADKRKIEKASSFCGKNLNKTGTLIEVLEEGKLTKYLIGDINKLSGVCDDCSGFSSDAIIKRYKIVYEKE